MLSGWSDSIMAQPLWTLCAISSRKFRIKSSWDSQCNTRERTAVGASELWLMCLCSFTQLWGEVFLPLDKPDQQLQRELPRARASSQNMTSQTLWLDAHPSLLKVYRLQGPWRESFDSVRDGCEAGKSFGNEVAFFTRA